MSETTLTLACGTVIEKGQKIYIKSRSYTFVEKGETSECIDFGETGTFKFISHTRDGIIVSDIEAGGTIFIYMGPDRVSKNGVHMRKPEITVSKPKTIKPVKRKSKVEVVLPPSVVGSKQKDLAPLPKKRGRPKGSVNKKKSKKTKRKA